MQKSSAEFIVFRKNELDILGLEERYGISVPPIYRSFIEVFDTILGDVVKLNSEELDTLSYYIYLDEKGNDSLFEDLMDLEDSLKFRNSSDIWVENSVMPITEHSHGGTILIGYSEANCDRLYYQYDDGLKFVENNIYTFLRNLRFEYNESYLKSNLYKNYGDDFWRIHE